MNKLTKFLLIIMSLPLLALTSCDGLFPDGPDPETGEDEIAVTGVRLSDSKRTLFLGDTWELTADILPAGATEQGVTWLSSDPDVVSVSADYGFHTGFITALTVGEATITVTTVEGEFTADCVVTVIPVSAEDVSLNHDYALLALGGSLRLIPIFHPENTTNQAVEWSSSDTSVITVDADGVLAGVAEGTAIVTVTTVDGEFTADCEVEVISQVMTMTTDEYVYDVSLTMNGYTNLSIDWGDGTVDFHWVEHVEQTFNHVYSYEDDNAAHTITIVGHDITQLDCSNNNNLSSTMISLDVSRNDKLEELYCGYNKLTSLDVSKNTALKELQCAGNLLTNLELDENTSLTGLSVSNNQLTELDLSENIHLTYLKCSDNALKTLKVWVSNVSRPGGYRGIEYMDCYNNELENITFLGSGPIGSLNCSGNKLTELNFDKVSSVSGYFKIHNNLLEAPALNAVFEYVHKVIQGINIIYVFGNPGADTCDPTIATKKGWEVDTTSIPYN